jgi:hypothetical protein
MHDELDTLIKPFALAAEAAHRAEADYARQFEIELARRKRAREFAFRRLGLVRELARAACAEGEEAAIAAQVDCLRTELGWHDLSPAKEKTIAEFGKLASVIHACAAGKDGKGKKRRPDIAAAMAEFEQWYEKRAAFWRFSMRDTGDAACRLLSC